MDRENILYALECIERAKKTVSQLCNGERKWIMCVPAQPQSDPDLIISEALRMSDNIIREALSALDTPATSPEDARELAEKIEQELCGIEGEPGHESVVVNCDAAAKLISAYADSIRKQCVRQAVNDWFLNPRIDHNETTLEAAIMRKE